jgi:hypothetical protein
VHALPGEDFRYVFKPALTGRRSCRRPAVGGISTAVIHEYDESGEDPENIADDFGLTVAQVRWALAYETSIPVA